MVDKSEITGAIGTPAPPGAPHEVTAPGSERPTAGQIAAARANEVELPPFNPGGGKQMTVEEQAIFLGKTVDEITQLRVAAGIPDEPSAAAGLPARDASVVNGSTTGPVVVDRVIPANPAPSPSATLPAGVVLDARGKPVTSSVMAVPPRPARSSLRPVHKPPTVVVGEPLEQQLPVQGLPEDADTLNMVPYMGQPRDRSSELNGFTEALVEGAADAIAPPDPAKHQPAASNTDSPARGTPPPMTTLPEGKRITGGFGDPAEAEYYPLDGSELRELVYALMDAIHARLADDLRFSFATTYPRCRARVVVEIDAFAQDQTLTVEKVMVPPHEKTPMEVARLYGDQVVFCVTAERAEMAEDGQSIAPPNQTRQELQLPIPRKTAVETPAGRMIVDVRQ